MRSRSLLAVLFFCFTALGLAGCGNSSDNGAFGGEFVNTNPPAPVFVGGLTFNFVDDVAAQAPFEVDPATETLRFQFFENVGAVGQPAVTTTSDYQSTVTITGLSTSLQSVKITGLDADGIPLYTITQAVTIVGGETTIVPAVAAPVAVTLQQLQLVSSPVTFTPVGDFELEVNGTAQLYIAAQYSDGTLINVSNAATFSNDANDPSSSSILSVGSLGQLRGLNAGETTVLVQFDGQTLTVPVTVVSAFSATFSAILIQPDPINIAAGASQSLALFGLRASDDNVFGINPAGDDVTLSVSGASSITVSNGVVSAAANAPGGAQAVLTATYTNANGTTVTDTATVVISGSAGVSSISAAIDQSNLYSGAPAITGTIALTETLTTGGTQTGANTNYTFTSSDTSVATVSAAGVVTAVGSGTATITVTSPNNAALTNTVQVTVTNATVTAVAITPVQTTAAPGGTASFTLNATLSNTQIVNVTRYTTFTLSNPANFSVTGNVVTVGTGATSGTSTNVIGTFDADGAGGAAARTASAQLNVQ